MVDLSQFFPSISFLFNFATTTCVLCSPSNKLFFLLNYITACLLCHRWRPRGENLWWDSISYLSLLAANFLLPQEAGVWNFEEGTKSSLHHQLLFHHFQAWLEEFLLYQASESLEISHDDTKIQWKTRVYQLIIIMSSKQSNKYNTKSV